MPNITYIDSALQVDIPPNKICTVTVDFQGPTAKLVTVMRPDFETVQFSSCEAPHHTITIPPHPGPEDLRLSASPTYSALTCEDEDALSSMNRIESYQGWREVQIEDGTSIIAEFPIDLGDSVQIVIDIINEDAQEGGKHGGPIVDGPDGGGVYGDPDGPGSIDNRKPIDNTDDTGTGCLPLLSIPVIGSIILLIRNLFKKG